MTTLHPVTLAAWAISGAFCSLTVPITLYEVRHHARATLMTAHERLSLRVAPHSHPLKQLAAWCPKKCASSSTHEASLTLLPPRDLQVANHLKNFRSPKLQRYVIRILWMPAVYSIDSWLSLRWKARPVLEGTTRELCVRPGAGRPL